MTKDEWLKPLRTRYELRTPTADEQRALKIIFEELRADTEDKQREIMRQLELHLRHYAVAHWVRNQAAGMDIFQWHAATLHHTRELMRLIEEAPFGIEDVLFGHPDDPHRLEPLLRMEKILTGCTPERRQKSGRPRKNDHHEVDKLIRVVEKIYIAATGKPKGSASRHITPNGRSQLGPFGRLMSAVFTYAGDPRGDDAVLDAIVHARRP